MIKLGWVSLPNAEKRFKSDGGREDEYALIMRVMLRMLLNDGFKGASESQWRANLLFCDFRLIFD